MIKLLLMMLCSRSVDAGFLGMPSRPALNAARRAKTATPFMYLPNQTPKVSAAPPLTGAKKPFNARLASRPILVPLLSYGGLAAAAVGASKLVVTVPSIAGATVFGLSMPVATVAAIAAPAVIMLVELTFLGGGERVAQNMGGRPADASLTRLATDVAERAGLQAPAHVYEIPTDELNAFAAGFGKGDATVAVTSGLRRRLNDKELEAVIAHEIGHIRHSDMRTNMHVAVAIAGLGGIYEMGKLLVRVGDKDSGEKRREKDKSEDDSGGVAALGLGLMVGGVAARFSAHLLQLSMSRSAEYDADHVAAELCGSDAMISALRKIQDASDEAKRARRGWGARRGAPEPALSSFRGGAFAHSYISNGATTDESSPSSAGKTSWWKRIVGVFSTHPTTEKRIEALQAQFILPPSTRGSTKTAAGSWF